MNSDTDIIKTFSELSQPSGKGSLLKFHIDDFVVTKVHITGSKNKTKHFFGKICSSPDKDAGFVITFL